MLCRYFEFTKNRLVPSYFFNIFSILPKIFEDGANNQMATYEKTKKKKIDGLTRH
jgi:hypothetical protein